MENDVSQAWMIEEYGQAEDLKLGSRPKPGPGEGELLVSVEAASLNPLDLKLIGGMMRDFMPVAFPFTPGSDVCGIIVARGAGAGEFEVGDRVVGMTPANGGMAEFAILSAHGPTAKIAETADAAIYATLPEVGMTAMTIMREAGEVAGKKVAVIGATGGIGLLLCQLAKQAGATVIATGTGDDDSALVHANGANEMLDYSLNDTLTLLSDHYPGGVDVLVDLINQSDALLASAAAVKAGGRLISTLVGPDPSSFPAGVEVRYVRLSPSASDLRQLVQLVEAAELVPTVSLRFPFAEVRDAYLTLREGHVRGKIIVEVAR